MTNARDAQADYRAAYVAEHANKVAAGNSEAAAYIAQILRDHFDHEVDPKPKAKAAPERADADSAPENTAAPRPRRKPRSTNA